MNKKQTYKNNYKEETHLDDYEKDLKECLDKGEFVSTSHFKETKKMFEEAAKRHIELQESKSITFRIKQKDLLLLKAKAALHHIPYQSLINLLINSYTKGKIK